MTVTITPVTGIPEVETGHDLAALISEALRDNGIDLIEGDVLVVSSKVASKALGLIAEAAGGAERDRVVETQSAWVVAERRVPQPDGSDRLARVVKATAGPVMAAAGVDASNTGGGDHLLLLPHDPDAVCRELHTRLARANALRHLGIILSDTAGRPWRVGQTDFALGAHGFRVDDDLRGGVDADGRLLEVTTRAIADEVAAAADLVKGKAAAIPVAHVRGLSDFVVADPDDPDVAGAASLVRTGRSDWFGQGRAEAVRSALGVPPGSALAARIGIPSVLDEPVAVRSSRAVGVAIHALDGVGVDLGTSPDLGAGVVGQRVVVSAADPYDLGLATARFLVAAWGEWLEAVVVARSAAAVTIDVSDRSSSWGGPLRPFIG